MKRFLIGALAGLSLAGGVAWATIPDQEGLIHGCYNGTGSLRVIDTDAGATCKRAETPLEWNARGPEGPPGPRGATGPAGADATALWGLIRMDGTIMRQKGIASVSASAVFPGLYSVFFTRDVTTCVASTSLGADDVLPVGEISSLIAKSSGGLQPNVVQVFTRNSDGTMASKSFFVQVFC